MIHFLEFTSFCATFVFDGALAGNSPIVPPASNPEPERIVSAASTNLSPQTLGALIGIFAFVLGACANHFFTMLRDRKNAKTHRSNVSTLANAEIKNIARHYSANKVKLESILSSSSYGDIVDYEKLRYHSAGLVAFKSSDVQGIHEPIALDILRLGIFVRNNDLHVKRLIEILQQEPPSSDVQKQVSLRAFSERMSTSISFCNKISEVLDDYSSDPNEKNAKPIDWPDSTWKLEPATKAE